MATSKNRPKVHRGQNFFNDYLWNKRELKLQTRAWAQNVQEDLLHLPICVLGHSKLLFSILAHPNASPYFTVKAIMLISESLNSSHETVAGGGILIKTITLLGTFYNENFVKTICKRVFS